MSDITEKFEDDVLGEIEHDGEVIITPMTKSHGVKVRVSNVEDADALRSAIKSVATNKTWKVKEKRNPGADYYVL